MTDSGDGGEGGGDELPCATEGEGGEDYRISSFHFYRWNQLKLMPWTVRSVQETS